MTMEVIDLKSCDFLSVLQLQEEILQKKINTPNHPEILILHSPTAPVITIGRSGGRRNILVPFSVLENYNIKVYEVDRGGDVTLHYPGQLVVYFVVDLKNYIKDVHWYLDTLEEIGIELLHFYGLCGGRSSLGRGVWIGEKKVIFIGIGVRRWVAFHGMAVNVLDDSGYFTLIKPCGIDNCKVSSINKEKGDFAIKDVSERLVEIARRKFS
jgi:lipoate-protein ligase B